MIPICSHFSSEGVPAAPINIPLATLENNQLVDFTLNKLTELHIQSNLILAAEVLADQSDITIQPG